MHLEIKKFKLKDGNLLEVEYDQHINVNTDDGEEAVVSNHISMKGGHTADDDLVKHFEALRLHFAVIFEAIPEDKIDPEEFSDMIDKAGNHPVLKNFYCNHVIFGGSGDDEGVTLCGGKKTSRKKVVPFNAPFTKFYDEASPYAFNVELKETIDELCNEIRLYINGKGKNVQLPLQFYVEEREAV